MKKSLKISLIVLAVIVLAAAYYLISPLFRVVEMNEESPIELSSGNKVENADVLYESEFIPANHDVAGKVLVIDDGDSRILRFEDFDTVNGPDLFIYLATDNSAEDYVNLGRIKATKGNVNYDIPANVDLEKYDTVLVWCRAFRVLFSYAELN